MNIKEEDSYPKKNQKSHSSGILSVGLALFGNGLITILKFVGFFISGSSVLFSEAIHSFADTANQSLLLIGIYKSRRLPDREAAYGYGQERFFWALISACGIFFVGAGVTLYHGIMSFTHDQEFTSLFLIIVLLLISFVVEFITFLVAIRELLKDNKNKSISYILHRGNPTTLAVIFEDGVAVLGVIIAFISIVLSKLTGWHYWDGIGSVVIGLLLGVVALVLINKNRKYLLGRTMPRAMSEEVLDVLRSDSAVEKIYDFKSSTIGLSKYRIKCEIEFNGSALLKKAYQDGSLKDEYERINGDYDEFLKFCVDFADRIPRLIGSRIDTLEKKIQTEVPEVEHLDIELN
ncbi:MAG: Cation efflux protein [Candidatus Falkowbacteria bacterium GW2011_GWC2_38_22]|uniref:Cation efflux protein n=1 Tax=Candidatus Falkowbacteria bacterium GW2011_GWE1_38_31 TaxID=1618638 RepID=A0A0G0JRM6_9BACT|nr:MAG: Cation efflux protein [Candidatus Falkowbacteria bacterium GW2011_GWF2_38_1205]KKQ61047.1 MAG: Cation efflux protein [Candidatus Falkowbacteria bacterium GW2011_GWC2_38_22]KKQ63424.1 MAG: Cation efflux protein [Candidatus Falkowbacteria bacterium GW2011_GWF1_38_22]KKQ65505.1 MAG: Cation efflux protein [Candidatus Falkowbacteria bacterium GW2011_GWE2_38_254]KKQ70188.1 MAG: Cation efflux protein [Candidatus Falkowbacteria bacterium GW2011_GWE1_38_31]KKQ72636.1 MAG: Cation efflux protein 